MASHVEGFRRKRKAGKEPGGPPQKVASPSVTSQAPRGINVAEFAEARALELHNMIQEISTADKKGSKRVFQSLPKHMRRRAASYNVKRMPVRLRELGKKEEKNQTDTPKQKKSRRQRRKPKSLLNDYNRRKKNNVWLETHIWHAKRMKMVNVWGYKLAEHPSDKSFRACHRAVSNTCLLQDISYYCCIEVKGNKCEIISAMSKITRKELGPTIASIEYMNTGKEGHVMLYHPDRYPYGAIGPASFLWRQFSTIECNSDEPLSQLWIWVHASCFDEALNVIQKVCSNVSMSELSERALDNCNEEDKSEKSRKNSTIVSSLQFDLARLRLTGPLAHALLVDMLEVICDRNVLANGEQNAKEASTFQDLNGVCESNNNSKESSHQSHRQDQSDDEATKLWKGLKSVSYSSALKPNCTIGLSVQDPRLGLPGKRTGIDATVVEKKTGESDATLSHLLHSKWPSSVAASSLWDADIRNHVKETKMDDHQLNSLRSNLLLSGTKLELGTKESHVPILLIQQPGQNGYGAGWDIILPAGWTMPFWIALVYRGARVGGLRESRNCSLESEVPHFPHDVPDTQAGKNYNNEIQNEGETKYSRYPPDKRPNYEKLGISSPFSNPWNKLVNEWSVESRKILENSESTTTNLASATNDSVSRPNDTKSSRNNFESLSINNDSGDKQDEFFYVLRDVSKVSHLRNMFKEPSAKNKRTHCTEDNFNLNHLTSIIDNSRNALVAVSLRMVNQGFPLPIATISIPSASDLKELEKCKKYGGPTEPLHKGPKRQFISKVSNVNTLIGCCTRDVIGFLTSGQYSLSRGYGVGIGYCALPGLARLLLTGLQGIVLVRNTLSQQYRFAYLSII
ncbi:ribonucleases P/MRP protein subunit POP1 [Exaiptasia diaphana]|uniref:Uncharacterized protein n=1 Tax=Exaiptasia diaphana TaxID=2652724 RepID=A0A913YB89_EXADI|nr:ribonucleases P/MRP protein subunit POP1 [Exaiptasia diaphana]KXJ21203.1 Ribonucleases P/MRP protein subunit POP1 [Exaiptasia diaphana]